MSATPGPWEISETFLKADFVCVFSGVNRKVEMKVSLAATQVPSGILSGLTMLEEKPKHLLTGAHRGISLGPQGWHFLSLRGEESRVTSLRG